MGMVGSIPEIQTARLLLRPFRLADAPEVQRLAGDYEIAKTTLHIPHPYPDGAAEAWISSHQERYQAGETISWAITLRSDDRLLGAIGLTLDRDNESGEIGYWVGRPYWNNGYATGAAGGVVAFGFKTLQLHRIQARHFADNPASGRVMQKNGMQVEGLMRQAYKRFDRWHDCYLYSILDSDFRE